MRLLLSPQSQLKQQELEQQEAQQISDSRISTSTTTATEIKTTAKRRGSKHGDGVKKIANGTQNNKD
jgi:hypothetical protein